MKTIDLKKLLKKKAGTLSSAAKEIPIARGYLSQVCNRKRRCSTEKAEMIAKYLDYKIKPHQINGKIVKIKDFWA